MSYYLVITIYVEVVLSEYRGNREVCVLSAGLIFPALIPCTGAKTQHDGTTFDFFSFSRHH